LTLEFHKRLINLSVLNEEYYLWNDKKPSCTYHPPGRCLKISQ
jgi:hypothetical protein